MDATRTTRTTTTLSAFRSYDFRLYFIGQLISVSGTWMQNIAQGYLIFSITHSELWLGIVACAAGVPMILFSPMAGVLVESIPRRRLLMITQSTQMLLAFVLALLTYTDSVAIWHILGLAFLLGLTNAFDMPARQTFVLEMVGRDDLYSGIALNSALYSSARVLGPTLAGVALVRFGPMWCFVLNGLSFFAVLLSLFAMHVPFAMPRMPHIAALKQLKEGLHYVREDGLLAPLLILVALVGFFVLPVIQILPAFAALVLHSPKEGYAALAAGQGIGSVVGGMTASWLAATWGRGRLIMVATILSGISLVLMSLQNLTLPAVIMVGFSGLFFILQVVNLNTLIQLVVSDEFRGRVLSLYSLGLLGLAPFGALLLGALAHLIGTPAALGLYGIVGGVSGTVVLLRWSNIIHVD